MSNLIPGVFLDSDQATRLYNVCMGVVEMADSATDENQIPVATLAVFKRELLNLLEDASGFNFIDRKEADFKGSAKKHLENERTKLDAALEDLKKYQ